MYWSRHHALDLGHRLTIAPHRRRRGSEVRSSDPGVEAGLQEGGHLGKIGLLIDRGSTAGDNTVALSSYCAEAGRACHLSELRERD